MVNPTTASDGFIDKYGHIALPILGTLGILILIIGAYAIWRGPNRSFIPASLKRGYKDRRRHDEEQGRKRSVPYRNQLNDYSTRSSTGLSGTSEDQHVMVQTPHTYFHGHSQKGHTTLSDQGRYSEYSASTHETTTSGVSIASDPFEDARYPRSDALPYLSDHPTYHTNPNAQPLPAGSSSTSPSKPPAAVLTPPRRTSYAAPISIASTSHILGKEKQGDKKVDHEDSNVW